MFNYQLPISFLKIKYTSSALIYLWQENLQMFPRYTDVYTDVYPYLCLATWMIITNPGSSNLLDRLDEPVCPTFVQHLTFLDIYITLEENRNGHKTQDYQNTSS